MALALVQSAVTSTGSGITVKSTSFGSNVTSGNTIVVQVRMTANNPVGTCADDLGNTYALSQGAENHKGIIFTAQVTTGGSCTVTYTAGGASTGGITVCVAEVSSSIPTSKDVSGFATSSGTTATGPTLVTSADTIMFASCGFSPFDSRTAGGGFTQYQATTFFEMDTSFVYRIDSAGTYTPTWSNSGSMNYEVAAIAIKEGASAPTFHALFVMP